MALSDIDRGLLQQCLAHKPRAWENFVDRFLGLVLHVVDHTAQSRSIRLSSPDREDFAADVFLAIVEDDYAVLRRFRGDASLATYLTVVSRRVVVRELLKRKTASRLGGNGSNGDVDGLESQGDGEVEQRVSNREEVERLMEGLKGPEAEIVRMFFLEGKSYQQISAQVGMPENSIGPTLSRAREKMRQASAGS